MAEQSTGRDFGNQLVEALRGPQLSKDEKYMAFLGGNEWFNKPTQPVNPEAAPSYYVEMTKSEREIHDLVIEFTNAANFKKARAVPPTLEVLSKYEGWGGLQTPEVKKLYEWPGVRKAMEIMVKAYSDDQPLAVRIKETRDGSVNEGYSLRTAKNRGEVLKCREKVRDQIQSDVARGYLSLGNNIDQTSRHNLSNRGLLNMGRMGGDPELLKLKAREAEQIAFALLYLSNTFESLDSKYNDMGRNRAPSCMNDLVNIPIKFAMNPLDTLLGSFAKDSSEVVLYGRFGEWAYNMALQSNNSKPPSIENVHFMADENKNPKDYWRVSNNGKDIIVPECYPRDLVKSLWEEVSVDTGGRTRTKLIDFLKNGEEIPWDKVSDSMYIDYALKLGKAGVISDILQGKIPIKWGDNDTVGDWIGNAQSALAKFGLRNADSVKRWMLYASVGIKPTSREPRLRDQNRKLQIKAQFGVMTGNYLPHDKLFFPWDKLKLFI